jgi:hypothetical protein
MTEIEVYDQKMSFINKEINKKSTIMGRMFIQEKIMMRVLAAQYEDKQFQGFISLIKQARLDMYQATYQNTHNFFWRNFSRYVDPHITID